MEFSPQQHLREKSSALRMKFHPRNHSMLIYCSTSNTDKLHRNHVHTRGVLKDHDIRPKRKIPMVVAVVVVVVFMYYRVQ